MVFADIMRPPDEGPDEYDDDDKAWLRNTASYYLRKLTPDQREELGISETEATKYLRSGKVMPCLIVSASGPRVDMLCALQDRAQPAAPVLPANATGGGASAAKSSATVAPPLLAYSLLLPGPERTIAFLLHLRIAQGRNERGGSGPGPAVASAQRPSNAKVGS